MKKRLWKRIAASIVCCMMLLTALPVMAAPVELTNAGEVKVDVNYFEDEAVLGPNQTVSLSVRKTQNVKGDDTDLGINGVVFKALRVGELYQVKLNQSATAPQNSINEYTMVYGIEKGFADVAGLTDKADYTFTYNGKTVYGFADTTPIVEVFKDNQVNPDTNKTTKEDIYDYVQNSNEAIEATTVTVSGKSGIATFEGVDAYEDLGLYVIVEFNVDKAELVKEVGREGKPDTTERIAITKEAYPYIVSLPTFDDAEWDTDVTVITKNKTDLADVTKKIVKNYVSGEALIISGENLVDTDTTYYGDTVEFRLRADLPKIPDTSEKSVTTFVLWDALSEGYTFNPGSSNVHVKIGSDENALTYDTDYTVSQELITGSTNYTDNAGSPQTFGQEYIGGNLIKIEFTDDGLEKLTTLSKSTTPNEDKAVYVYYLATVNEKAIVGPNDEGEATNSGNPNMVMLEYAVTGHTTKLKTDWDKVTEFTFGIDAEKYLMVKNDTREEERIVPEDKEHRVEFVLFKKVNDKPVYYTFTGNKDASDNVIDGEYDVLETVESKDNATRVSPLNGGKLTIRGLEPGTYYLQEVDTVSGYNLLKEPIEVKLTAKQGENTYTYIEDGDSKNEYLGTLTIDNDTDGITSLKVINTKGFILPSTGGMGIGLFVLVGAAVVAAGIIYYVSSGKKEKKC